MALLMSQPKYEVPTEIQGFINDDHVQTESFAVFFGELYFDFQMLTKLTLGLRYNDDTVTDNNVMFNFLWVVMYTHYHKD